MSTFFSNIGNISVGCLGQKGRLTFCLLDRELIENRIEHSLIYVWENAKLSEPITLNWTVTTICHPKWEHADFIAIGRYGHILRILADNSFEELTNISLYTSSPTCLLRDAKVIGNSIYIVGSSHRMFRLDADLSLHDISVPSAQRQAVGNTTGFEAVDGFSKNEIYAVGWDGEIWLYDGKNWENLYSPTNLINTGVVCSPHGEVYIVGQMGTIIRGRKDRWSILKTDLNIDLWAVRVYQDKIHMCSMHNLFRLEDEQVVPLALEPAKPQTFAKLDSIGHAMLSVGMDDVVLLVSDKAFKVV